MDLTSRYCATRRHLEETNWKLVSKLAGASGELLKLAGKSDHMAFATAKHECVDLRARIDTGRTELQEHRSAHGC